MSKIRFLLEAISNEASKLGIDPASQMYRGVTQAQVADACRALPFELPADVIELFLWRNGVRLEGQACETRIFPRFYFRSIETSVETTRALILHADDPEMQWEESWFCLCTDLGGDCYALETAHESEDFGRIFAVKEVVDPYPAFWSFEAMLLSVAECFRMGVYFLDEDGCLSEDEEQAETIYRRFNHGLSPFYTPSPGDITA